MQPKQVFYYIYICMFAKKKFCYLDEKESFYNNIDIADGLNGLNLYGK